MLSQKSFEGPPQLGISLKIIFETESSKVRKVLWVWLRVSELGNNEQEIDLGQKGIHTAETPPDSKDTWKDPHRRAGDFGDPTYLW